MPNAFATGKGQKELGAVTVTTGLLDLLDTEELEGVLAHELTHIRNRDVLVLTLASIFSTIAAYLMQFGFYGGLYGGGMGGSYGGRDDRNNGSAFIIMLLVASFDLDNRAFLLLEQFRDTENIPRIEVQHR